VPKSSSLSTISATPARPVLAAVAPAPSRPSVEPILKWAGGKTRLLPELVSRLPRPSRGTRAPRYFEPFVGGAALFFHLRPERAQLSDFNPELVHLYRTIRDDVEALIVDLGRHTHERGYYYAVRALDPETLPPIERASRMVFLNRTCFNGLWRVNRDGRFNVPFGSYTNPTLCPADRLRAASQALQGVAIEVSDFEAAVADARKGDFVYFDPPYVPLTPTASFTSYTGAGFGAPAQQRLAALFSRLAVRGVHCLLSNSDTPLVRSLYASHHIDRVLAPRSISRDATKRDPVGEVIVRSYPL
jgi:DNA adenine methylase